MDVLHWEVYFTVLLFIQAQFLTFAQRNKTRSESRRREINCYCNEPDCASTGYMCRSVLGKCFSQLTYGSDNTRSVHGCVDSLPKPDRTACLGEGDIITARSEPAQWPLLMCCKDNMCNYIDKLDIINVGSHDNSSDDRDLTVKQRNPSYNQDKNYSYNIEDSYQQGGLWFKAAVIAVPIAGGFILILLVLLAVRMLRTDSRRHRQLMQMRRHCSFQKAQLYVADHFCTDLMKGEVDSQNGGNITPQGELGGKQNTVYKDVNIKIDYDGHPYEKIQTAGVHRGSCSSILIWGGHLEKQGGHVADV